MDPLSRLVNWYAAECNGDWEHSYGIKLETLDNPGWALEIDLFETDLAGKPFTPVHRGDSEADAEWLRCEVVNYKFVASGGARNLAEIVTMFLKWADS